MNMTSDQITAALRKIADTPGKNDKQDLVKAFCAFPAFKRVLVAALSPAITYGMKAVPTKQPDIAPGTNTFENAPIWDVLTKLEKRELTGSAAREEVQKWMNFLTDDSAWLFSQIIQRDLRAGFGESTVNKACPGLIPEFPYMRCSLPKKVKLDKFDWDGGVVSQEKADGSFFNGDKHGDGRVFFRTRQGTPYPEGSLHELEECFRTYIAADTQTHGELVVYQDGVIMPREDGNGVLNSVAQGGQLEPNQRVVAMVWDQIPLAAAVPKGKHEVHYRQRLSALIRQLPKPADGTNGPLEPLGLVATKVVRSLAEARAHFKEMLKQKKEGTVFKNGTAIWKDGTSTEQVKLKVEFTVDLIIKGFEPGKGKNAATFGSLICETADGQLEVAVSGFSDALRKAVHESREDYLETIMAVTANGVMAPGESSKKYSLFLPRYSEFRTDKKTADTLQQVFDQFEAAVEAA